MSTQLRTWRATHRTYSTTPTRMRIPRIAKIVRGRKWTMRSMIGSISATSSVFGCTFLSGMTSLVTLRANPVEDDATLPDGRVVRVRVALADDSYIKPRDLDTVTLELIGDHGHLAAVTTLL